NELMEWEYRTTSGHFWDPLAFDQSWLQLAETINICIVVAATVSFVCNSFVLIIAFRRRNLLDSSANVVAAATSLNHALLALYTFIARLYLAFHFKWTKPICLAFAITNVYFTSTGSTMMVTFCIERYLSLVHLIRIPARQMMMAVSGHFVTTAIFTVLHFINGGTAIMTRTGLTCQPTALYTWIGAIDTAIIMSSVFGIASGYSVILYKLRSIGNVRNVPQRLKLGETTMLALGQPARRPSKLLQRASSVAESIKRSVLARGEPIVDGRRSANGPISSKSSDSSTKTTSHHVATSTSQTGRVQGASEQCSVPEQNVRALANANAIESQAAEMRVVMRGVLSMLAYLYIIPFCVMLLDGYTKGQRPAPGIDAGMGHFRSQCLSCDKDIQ
ncbi:hypothetical protein BCR44DRAFT_362007, partial [Catenaria anguillulae PL171]